MTATLEDQLADYRALAGRLDALLPQIEKVAALLRARLAAGGTVYSFGNGGSAADAQHLTGELAGHFRRDRAALRAVTIGADPVLTTAIGNDYDFTQVFARPLASLAGPGDVAVGFTTSGSSPNVVAALVAARANGAATVLFGAGEGGPARQHADVALLIPSTDTARIQEAHTLCLHLISDVLDEWAAA